MKKTIFTGSGVALVTPFNEDTSVNYEKLTELLEFHIKNKTDAIIICGTTGEATTMPDREHIKVIEHTVKVVNKRIPVIAGTGSNDTAHGIELSKETTKLGVDGLLIVTPYYNKATQKGLIKHYELMAQATNAPICLYNVPSRTGMNITIDTLKELAKIDNIVALKEASGNMSYAMQVAREVPQMDLYSGNDDIIVPMLSIGGKGVISVVSNILPLETHNICEYYFKNEVKKSAELQLHMLDLINKLFIEVNPIPIKTAMNLMGMNAGPLRLPLCDMENVNLEKLKSTMMEIGIKLI